MCASGEMQWRAEGISSDRIGFVPHQYPTDRIEVRSGLVRIGLCPDPYPIRRIGSESVCDPKLSVCPSHDVTYIRMSHWLRSIPFFTPAGRTHILAQMHLLFYYSK